ncbi:MAG: hypothetical protein ACK58X_15050 [Planctomycetota bacterium]
MDPRRPLPLPTALRHHAPSACLFLLAAATTAQQAVDDPTAILRTLSPARQAVAATALLADLAAAPPDAALLAFVHALAGDAERATPERTKVRGSKRAARTVEFPAEAERLPRRVDYRFGLGVLAAAGDGKALAKAAAGQADPIVLRQALHGAAPDADKALAALLRRLDADARGDAFAAFLQGWRNGDESFYEALDRTAGTKDSVFFYDAMLDDFRGHFGKGDGGQRLGGGLRTAHDALHDAFLAYRQYRGFREAVAWSLLLPPATPLPTRLARYEAKAAGAYSLREQVVMAGEALGHDVDAVVAAVLADAPPLPQPVWSAAYDPYPAWSATFASLQARMIEHAGSTDAFLQRAQARRAALAAALRQRAVAALDAATAAKSH